MGAKGLKGKQGPRGTKGGPVTEAIMALVFGQKGDNQFLNFLSPCLTD